MALQNAAVMSRPGLAISGRFDREIYDLYELLTEQKKGVILSSVEGRVKALLLCLEMLVSPSRAFQRCSTCHPFACWALKIFRWYPAEVSSYNHLLKNSCNAGLYCSPMVISVSPTRMVCLEIALILLSATINERCTRIKR